MMKTTTMSVAGSPFRILSLVSALAIVPLLHGRVALAASLSVSSAQVQEPDGTARVCVALSSGGEDVAATQNDLVWDASCASVVGNCVASSAHGKQLMSNQKGAGALRAIVISLQDTNPIPDGELYCCTFRASLGSGGSCCAIGVQNVDASDPDGKALGLAGRGGQICLASKSGSGGGLDGGSRQPQDVVSADLGGAQQQAPPPAGQPAAQEAAPKAGSGNVVASGGTGGVQGGVGGAPGGIGGVPGGQPGAPGQPGQGQPGQIPQQQAAAPGSAPAAGRDAARDPVAAAPQQEVGAAEGTPTRAPAAARPTSAPAAAAPREAAPVAKPGATAPGSTTSKAAAPAPAPQASGCSCEIAPTGVGFEGSGALVAVGLLLWARRRRI